MNYKLNKNVEKYLSILYHDEIQDGLNFILEQWMDGKINSSQHELEMYNRIEGLLEENKNLRKQIDIFNKSTKRIKNMLGVLDVN